MSSVRSANFRLARSMSSCCCLGHRGQRLELRRDRLQADDLQPARLADLGDLHVEHARALLHLGALAVGHREDHGDDPRLEQRGEIDRHAGAADDRS